jgi:cell division protein FtsW
MSAPPRQIPFDWKSDWKAVGKSSWQPERRAERGAPAEPSVASGAGGADGMVIAAAAVLTSVGVVMIYSATAAMALGATLPPHFVRHGVGIALGLLAGFIGFRVPLATWRRAAIGLWIAAVVLVAVTDVVGVKVNGARRWLAIPGLGQFQPGELAKVATLLAVASVLAARQGQSAFSLRALLVPAGLALVPAALLVAQPDMGNAVVLLALAGALLFVAGAPLRLFVLPALAGAAGLAAYVAAKPYAWSRIAGFLHPWETASREGYQLVQSFVAFGRGSAFGIGLGASRQKLAYLPEAHTDFILSVVAEELGLVGVLVVIGAFVALLLGGARIARRARDRFSLLVATAMTLFLTLPAAINGAVVMGLVPTKGLAMPFLSYGRSSTIACFLALGLLLGIARREAAPVRPTVAGAERRSVLA